MKAPVKKVWAMAALLFLISTALFAHGDKGHKKHTTEDSVQTSTAHDGHADDDSTGAHAHAEAASNGHEHGLEGFPTLHPMVVHFPIVLLLLAALLQWIGLFVYKREISFVAWGILALGYLGAYASSNWFHAHTAGLEPAIQAILEEHEKYASYTQWLSGIALAVQSVNLFFLKRNFWVSIAAALLMSTAAAVVGLAAHHGAELIHKHGIGAKGYMLEKHNH